MHRCKDRVPLHDGSDWSRAEKAGGMLSRFGRSETSIANIYASKCVRIFISAADKVCFHAPALHALYSEMHGTVDSQRLSGSEVARCL